MSISRRGFLEKSALASSFFIVPRHVLGGKGFLAPSDKLVVAGIGVGGKGKSDLKKFYESHGFVQTSEMYLEDDIPHIQMEKSH